ncbi:MAG TPA: hypothetical protein VF178_08850 [Gemmatimonadaceae bacterium]
MNLRRLAVAWWAVPCLALVFFGYSHSFNTFPILERQHSVLADADAAPFAILLRDFSPTRKYGNEYNTHERSIRDIAQKHKTHHFLYAAVGGTLYRGLHGAYATLGADPAQALYGVNALIGCLNLVLLYLLLTHFGARGPYRVLYLALYAVALGTWIYDAIPESWPFTATLALGWVLVWYRRRPPYLWMATAIGVVMLNNLLLGSLGMFILLRRLQEARSPARAMLESFAALGVLLVTWTAGLTLLSVFDESLRPDHFIAYTIWFKQFTGAGLPIYDPYVWKSALTNLFINPVASHQPDPAVPQEALLATLTGSRLGLATVAAYLLVMGFAMRNVVLGVLRRHKEEGARGWVGPLLADDGVHLVLYCAVFALLVVVMFFGAGFLYSCVTIPFLVLIMARYVDPDSRVQRLLLFAMVALIAVNNALQILEFRAALRPML